MKRLFTVGSLMISLTLLGCGPPPSEEAGAGPEEAPAGAFEPSAAPSFPEPAPPVAAPAASTASMMGRLSAVDVADSTFTLVADDGMERTFRFSESTAVGGEGGVEGLATREGRNATVYYDPATDPPTALSVEVSPL